MSVEEAVFASQVKDVAMAQNKKFVTEIVRSG
jgi:hypothetical protein